MKASDRLNDIFAREVNMQHIMKIEEVRDLVANSTTPSEAVEAIESYLVRSQNSHEAIHATVWLLVINHFQLRLRKEKS